MIQLNLNFFPQENVLNFEIKKNGFCIKHPISLMQITRIGDRRFESEEGIGFIKSFFDTCKEYTKKELSLNEQDCYTLDHACDTLEAGLKNHYFVAPWSRWTQAQMFNYFKEKSYFKNSDL